MEASAPLELRLAGRTLTGAAMTYGVPARYLPEMFEARALEPVSGMALVIQHDPVRPIASVGDGLEVTHTDTEFRIETELREGSAELSLVRRRTLTGLSVGFVSLEERRDVSGMRVISRARLHHVGLVDRSSYAAPVELRQLEDAWLRGRISYGRELACRCQGPTCEAVIFEPGSLQIPDELLAINGPATRVLGSRRRGTLVVRETDEALEIGLVGPRDGVVAREVTDAARVAPIHVRPILDDEDSDFIDEGGVRRFTRASVRALLIKTAVADRGHIPVEIDGVEARQARRRLWL